MMRRWTDAQAKKKLEQLGYVIERYHTEVYPVLVRHRRKAQAGRFWTIASALHCLNVNGRVY